MALPISVLEIVDLAERAISVYDKCRSAKADFNDLAEQVHILSYAINEVKEFVESETIPRDVSKIASLQSARASCAAVLGEVEGFLEKYAGVNRLDRRRYIEIFKFILQDLDALKQKISHCASFLQLGLASLNTLSMGKVQSTLDTILREYRSGRREPSVLSQARGDNKAIERRELIKQLESDLENKNVHPDAIELNGNLISSWLTRVVNDGGFEEESEDIINGNTIQLDRTSSYHDVPPAQEWQRQNSFEGGSQSASVQSPSSEHDPILIPVDEMDSSSRQEARVRTKANPTANSINREDWHPYTRPDNDYIYAMLDGFFKCDYTQPPSLDRTRLRIIRAFNQQDWGHRGNLSRPEVIQLCSQVLQRAGVRQQGEVIRKKVLMADKNRNGQLDKDEFIELMDNLIQFSAEVRGKNVDEQLNAFSRSLQNNEEQRRELTSNKTILPWKWAKKESNGNIQYVDELTNVATRTLPPGGPSRDSFTIMALEADICVEKINDFKQHWLGIVPQSLQSEFLEALDTIHAAAIKFTSFELASDDRQLSDYDAMISCYKILTKMGREAEIPEAITMISQLEKARASSLILLSLIQAICWRLLSFSTAEFESNAQSFPQFQKMWTKVNVSDFSRQLSRRFADGTHGWGPIERTTSECCKLNLLDKLEGKAIEVVQSYIVNKQEELSTLKAGKWPGMLLSVKVQMPNINRIMMGLVDDKRRFYVCISVDAPPQRYESTYEKAGQAITWSMSKPISLFDYSCIEITVFEQRGGIDVEFYKFQSVTPEEYTDKNRVLDFMQRQPGEVKLKYRSEGSQWTLVVRMDDQSATAREMTQLARCSWMDLLNEQVSTPQEPDLPQPITRRRPSSKLIPKLPSDTISKLSQETKNSWGSTKSSGNKMMASIKGIKFSQKEKTTSP